MKTSLLTTLSFLLLSSTKLLLVHSDGNDPVLDMYNNLVTSDNQYIIKVDNTNSNVLSHHDGMNDLPCPFDVVQEPLFENATLATFYPSDGSAAVTVSANLVVHFEVTNPYCGTPDLSLWKVDTTNATATQWPIVIGEFLETDPETQFQLERDSTTSEVASYKFVYYSSESDRHYLKLSFEWGAYRLFAEKSHLATASKFVFIPTASERIKLVTSN